MKLSPQLLVGDFVQAFIGGCHAGKLDRINWACRKFMCRCKTCFISEYSTLLSRSRALRPLGLSRKQATCVAPLKFYVEPIQWKAPYGKPQHAVGFLTRGSICKKWSKNDIKMLVCKKQELDDAWSSCERSERLRNPSLSIHKAQRQEWRRFPVCELVRPCYPACLIRTGARTSVLAIIHRPAPRTRHL